jgi:hypothetical protein
MKIIRTIWGRDDHQFFSNSLKFYHDECRKASEYDKRYKLDNQLVIVWDEPNRLLMEELGYPYHYMGESRYSFQTNFLYKILALKQAMSMFDEILFLDWDCFIQKPLDWKFYERLRGKGPIQMPLYFYPPEILEEYKTISPFVNEAMHYFNMFFYNMLRLGKWKFWGGLTLPNAGFIYCRDKEFFNALHQIQIDNGITSNVEEVCALIYFNKLIETTDEYLDRFEPVVCLGKDDLEMKEKQVILNQYSTERLKKDIYFIHE